MRPWLQILIFLAVVLPVSALAIWSGIQWQIADERGIMAELANHWAE